MAHEGHDSHDGGSHSSQKHGSEGEFKKQLFLVLLGGLAVVLFMLFRNVNLITQNLPIILVAVIIVYLLSRFDYVLLLKEYERAVIFRFGKVNRVGGPGWALNFPPFETYDVVDLRTQTVDIPKQDVVTKDNIEIVIDAAIYLKVKKDNASVINSVIEVDDYIEASETFVVGLIRSECGKLELSELIFKIEELDKNLKDDLEGLAARWGVEVEGAVIQDIQIPKTVLDAMHEQKAAIQKKLARIEAAQGHQAEIMAVKEAAQQLNDRALAYYYVKALEKLGEGKSTKIIFPMELTNLAKALSGNREMSSEQIESLMEKYAPVVKSLVGGKKGKN